MCFNSGIIQKGLFKKGLFKIIRRIQEGLFKISSK
jgi:hypothetical protein